MHSFLFFLFWGSLGLAIFAIALTLFVPKYRKQLTQSNRATLEARYATEIAAGTAIIIPKDLSSLKKFIFSIACAGVSIVLFQQLRNYLSVLDQTCTEIKGWNSLIIYFGIVFILSWFGALFLLTTTYQNYQGIIQDGFTPSRKTKFFHDRIAFQLTKKRKMKEQLRLILSLICCIYLFSVPLQLTYILLSISEHKPTSVYELNQFLQNVCLDNLKE